MAFPVTLNGRTYTLADFEGTNYVDGLPDAFEDFVTHAGAIYKTTSTTSNTIGTGSKSFTTADNSLPYQVGTPLRITDSAAPSTNWMDGIVTAYSGTSLTVDVVSYAGSGTKTSWNINIGGGGTSYTGTLPIAQGGTGATTAGAAATNLGLGTGDSPTFTGLSVDGGTIKLDGNYPTGTRNVAMGDIALDSASLTGGYNTAIGHGSLSTNTSGTQNSAFGDYSLVTNSSGSYNVGVGASTLLSNDTGNYNVAAGYLSLFTNTTSWNTAVGAQAAYSNQTGVNTAVGSQALYTNSTGTGNTAIGGYTAGTDYAALFYNTSGSYNTAIGGSALRSQTTANYSTAVGYTAGFSSNGSGNTFIGFQAGYYSIASGGSINTFVGHNCGSLITTGEKNTILGAFTGNQGGVDIRTASNHIVLSDGDGNPRVYWSDQGMLFQITNYNSHRIATFQNTNNGGANGTISSLLGSACNNTSSYHFIGNISGTGDRMYVYGNGNVVNSNNSYGALSDEKLKENIVDSGSQWDDIKALRVRKYSMKEDALDAPNKLGVIAQELEAAGMGGLVFESPDRDEDGNILDTSTKQVIYSVLYMKAVKALQEAMDRIEILEAKVAALETP